MTGDGTAFISPGALDLPGGCLGRSGGGWAHRGVQPVSARFPDRSAEDAAYLRTTLRHSLNLARSAYALLEPGRWQGVLENILYLGLPLVEELVFTGRWKAVKKRNSRRTDE